MVTFVEKPVQIGRGEGLSAVLTHPVEIDTGRPFFVILNAGLLHRIGPFRLHVQLARRLAQQGFPVLRLDLSGLGYSPKHPELQGLDAALADIDVVLRWLHETYSLTRPVLLGSCSGADIAHRVAVVDERIVGCVFLDGYAYQNARSVARYYAARVHRPEIWGDWMNKRLLPSRTDGAPEDDEEEFWDVTLPPIEKFRSDLANLVSRGLSLLYIYSGSVREYNYDQQLFDVFPEARGGAVAVRYFPRANHIYMLERDRHALLESVSNWATTSFVAGDEGQPGT